MRFRRSGSDSPLRRLVVTRYAGFLWMADASGFVDGSAADLDAAFSNLSASRLKYFEIK